MWKWVLRYMYLMIIQSLQQQHGPEEGRHLQWKMATRWQCHPTVTSQDVFELLASVVSIGQEIQQQILFQDWQRQLIPFNLCKINSAVPSQDLSNKFTVIIQMQENVKSNSLENYTNFESIYIALNFRYVFKFRYSFFIIYFKAF